jgi:uncharacterized protein
VDFIKATEQGKNDVWRYVVGFITVVFFWLVLGALPVLAAILWVQLDGNPTTGFNPATGTLEGVGPIWPYVVPNLTFPIFLLGIFIVVRVLHQRRLRTLVTPAPRVNWRRVALGFGLWFVLALLSTGLEFALFPDSFTWHWIGIASYLPFLLLALIFTPIQTTAEELFFRGYLLQATGRVTGAGTLARRLVAAIINGILFALPHAANPEVQLDPVLLMLFFFGMGAFLAWITLEDGTAELAIGAHAANNLFVALLVNYDRSALPTPALVMTDRLDPLYSLIAFIVSAVIFTLLVFTVLRRPRKSGDGL